MRLGIRLQILLALGGLLLLALCPLFFAVAGLTSTQMTRVRDESARSLGRAIAALVGEARRSRASEALEPLLAAQVGPHGVAALAVYDAGGLAVARAGDEDALAALPARLDPGGERLIPVTTSRGRALAAVVPGPGGAVAAVVRTDVAATQAAPVVRLSALYTAVVALALLVFLYIAMTRLLVQPLDRLARAARRVAEGARSLDVPRGGARELSDLGRSVAEMTERLRADEQALRDQVEELTRTTRELRDAQDELLRRERLASVGRLAAGLAHEIGNPLSAQLGMLELLLAGGLTPEEQRDFLQRIQRETERIHRVIRDLLDFARPAEAGSGRPGAVDLAVEEVLGLLRPQPRVRDLQLATEIAADLPPVALGHERMIQVLLNLLLNATDAAPSGGHVAVRAARRGERVRVEVEDDGPGIAPEVRSTLFEPFVTTKEVGRGTGLGLAVCRGLVQAAGGTIGVEPGARGGARFVLELPALATAEGEGAAAGARPSLR